jgi:hypothetical protein
MKVFLLICGIALGVLSLSVYQLQKRNAVLNKCIANQGATQPVTKPTPFSEAQALFDGETIPPPAMPEQDVADSTDKTPAKVIPAKVAPAKAKAKWQPKPKAKKKVGKRKQNNTFRFERVSNKNRARRTGNNCVCAKPAEISKPKKRRRHRHHYKLLNGTFPCECSNPNS